MNKIFKKSGIKYFFSFIILILILISMTINPLITNILGEEILIKTKAYDPRDLFRGDYIHLNYDINEITIDLLDDQILDKRDIKDNSFYKLKGKKLYVMLIKNEKFYEVERVTLKRPNEGVFITAKYSYDIWSNNGIHKIKGIRVNYTLDKYYVPENTGKELEEKVRNGEAFAKIKVYKGYSLLKEIIEE